MRFNEQKSLQCEYLGVTETSLCIINLTLNTESYSEAGYESNYPTEDGLTAHLGPEIKDDAENNGFVQR